MTTELAVIMAGAPSVGSSVWFGVLVGLLAAYCLQECINLSFGSGAVQRLTQATLKLCIKRCQSHLMRFLGHLSGFTLRRWADLIDGRRIFLISQLAQCFGYLFVYFFLRHKIVNSDVVSAPNK
jgi:hypothetical protein